jgi:putative two-component system response regulator
LRDWDIRIVLPDGLFVAAGVNEAEEDTSGGVGDIVSEKRTVLIVDDTPEMLDVLGQVLRPEFRVKATRSGERALGIAAEDPAPDLILTDVEMPVMSGYQLCEQLKANPVTKRIPVIFLTSRDQIEDEKRGLELGAVDYITKPISPPIVLARLRTHLALADQQRELEHKVAERTQELNQTRLDVIRQLGRAAEFKDNETGLHVIRMSHYSRFIAYAYTQDAGWADLILNASPMHDIGKIGIPDNILQKPGPLTDEEFAVVRKHPEMGAKIIGDHNSELMKTAREIALSHHEKWDGYGYPKRLRGDQTPLSGRITAIADVFDALTSVRPYKKAWSVADAVAEIDRLDGIHFDPDLVPVFHEVLPEILDIKEQYDEPNQKGQGLVDYRMKVDGDD